jgi:A/G-specific adenine glycosylase
MNKEFGAGYAESEVRVFKRRLPALRRSLLKWFSDHQRDYPWRKTNNWFHLLMAEMMLRRTRADQVVPVYLEFCRRYPTPRDAARAPAQAFAGILQPLGLAWRGRQLRETVQFLSDRFENRPPAPIDALEEIPGVGPYSNAMLRNRLFEERIAAVDSNVARFVCRLLGRAHHAESRRDREIIELANRFVNSPRSPELNLAILDLSALVCKPRTPQCPVCPLRGRCETGRRAASES